MRVRLSVRLRRIALKCFLASAAAMIAAPFSSLAMADELGCGGYAQTHEDVRSSCEFELREAASQAEELCGWGTHDSFPIAPPRIATRTSSTFETSMAAAAATACASAGISVEQIVEPFAMVGPHVTDSLAKVTEFQEWWRSTVEAAQEFSTKDLDAVEVTDEQSIADVFEEEAAAPIAIAEPVPPQAEIQVNLDALALEEPVDITDLGPSVLVMEETSAEKVSQTEESIAEEVTAEKSTALASIVDAAASQVGASAVIATIEESYMPYDLSASDLRLWSVFPLVREPFCIRSRVESDESSLWNNFDEIVVSDAARVEEVAAAETEEVVSEEVADSSDEVRSNLEDAFVIDASADCLLEEFVWNVETAIDTDSPIHRWLDPSSYGQELARLVVSGKQVAAGAAGRLASVWPAVEAKPLVEETAGDRLLARAEAIDASEPITINQAPAAAAAQIAEVPAASTIR